MEFSNHIAVWIKETTELVEKSKILLYFVIFYSTAAALQQMQSALL